jgi:hypothetical protein
MKKRLDQFTMGQFIDIACGDYTAIGADSETAKQTAASLMEQYNYMADPATARARLLDDERYAKNGARIKLYRILLNIINLYETCREDDVQEAYNDVRDILILAGQERVAGRDNAGMKSKIEQMLRSEESQHERMESERKANTPADMSEDDFRASFDMQTARLMAHFKFSINHDRVTASVYANLVNMACKQQRQQASK